MSDIRVVRGEPARITQRSPAQKIQDGLFDDMLAACAEAESSVAYVLEVAAVLGITPKARNVTTLLTQLREELEAAKRLRA